MKVYIVFEDEHDRVVPSEAKGSEWTVHSPAKIHDVYFTREAANRRRDKLAKFQYPRIEYLYVIEKTIKGESLKHQLNDMVAKGHIKGLYED